MIKLLLDDSIAPEPSTGAKLPNLTILLPVEKAQMESPHGEKTLHVAGR